MIKNTAYACWTERRSKEDENRCPYERDRGRITHSFSFRRLQGKMQVLGQEVSDFHRTRLTHSLEVAQIGHGIVSDLKSRDTCEFKEFLPKADLIEAVCLAHDLGHPPYGHGGEKALNACLKGLGEDVGFEGNGQTLRIVGFLEPKVKDYGLNLTRRTLLGLLKYPVKYSTLSSPPPIDAPDAVKKETPPKCFMDSEADIVDWILEVVPDSDRKLFTKKEWDIKKGWVATHKNLDASIMDIADELAYAIHDLDDAVFLKLITLESVRKSEFFTKLTEAGQSIGLSVQDIDNLFNERSSIRQGSGSKVIRRVLDSGRIVKKGVFEEKLLDLNYSIHPECKKFISILNKDFIFPNVVKAPTVRVLEKKGEMMVESLFHFFLKNGVDIMPDYGAGRRYKAAKKNGENGHIHIADYIAGMTDKFCVDWYARAFLPHYGNISDRL